MLDRGHCNFIYIYAYIDPSNYPNVGIYTIHGAFGKQKPSKSKEVDKTHVVALPECGSPRAPNGSQLDKDDGASSLVLMNLPLRLRESVRFM